MTGQLKPHGPKRGLHIPAPYAAAIRNAAAAAYPDECCGLLVGEGDATVTITDVVPTTNTAADPRRTFAIDPQAQFDLLHATRDQTRRVVGHYHSHPDGDAVPSVHDLAMAHDPSALWVIIAASAENVSVLRAFQHPEGTDTFIEIPVTALS